MDKPWEGLRVSAPKPPIGVGCWQARDEDGCAETPLIELALLGTMHAAIRFGGDTPACRFSIRCLRLLAEFANELASQIESNQPF
jgi:hypothetical protein